MKAGGLGYLIGVALAAGLLSGCPRPEPKYTSAEPVVPEAEEVLTPGQMPADWPAELPPYPGATIIEGRARQTDSGLTLSARLHTVEGGEAVSNFYADKALSTSYKVSTSTRAEGKWLSVYQRGALNFAVTIEEDNPTEIDLALIGLPDPNNTAATPPEPNDDGGTADAGSSQADDTGTDPDTDGVDSPRRPDKSGHPLLPIYPGASTTRGVRSDRSGATLDMTTTDTMEQVQAYYRQFYTEQGFVEEPAFALNTQQSAKYTRMQQEVTVLTGQPSAADGDGELLTQIHLRIQSRDPLL